MKINHNLKYLFVFFNGKARKSVFFQKNWTQKFKLVREDRKNSNNACCHPCNTTFSLRNMGRGALVSHENGIKTQDHYRTSEKNSSRFPNCSLFSKKTLTLPRQEPVNESKFQLLCESTKLDLEIPPLLSLTNLLRPSYYGQWKLWYPTVLSTLQMGLQSSWPICSQTAKLRIIWSLPQQKWLI